jgi:hypothetical protein
MNAPTRPCGREHLFTRTGHVHTDTPTRLHGREHLSTRTGRVCADGECVRVDKYSRPRKCGECVFTDADAWTQLVYAEASLSPHGHHPSV